MADTSVLSLSQLDEPAAYKLDPSVWTRNFDALRAVDEPLAEQVARRTLPDSWRPVVSLDGFATWRTGHDARDWLGRSAAPLTRARGLLERYYTGGQNACLSSMESGAAAQLLLRRCAPHEAVFVFESDPATLAAVLRLHDFSAQVRARRLILLPPGDEQQALLTLLSEQPGLVPPGNILRFPFVDDREAQRISAVCGGAVSAVTAQRERRAISARQRAANGSAPSAKRIAILACDPSLVRTGLVDSIADGARQSGRHVSLLAADTPLSAGHLPYLEQIAADEAAACLFVGDAHSELVAAAGARAIVWHCDAPAADRAALYDRALHLAGTPAAEQTLARRGVAPARRAPFYLAAPSVHGELATATIDDLVVILGDLPNCAPDACGITQPTHKLIWEQARRFIAANWQLRDAANAEHVLCSAQRAVGVEISDEQSRARLLRQIAIAARPAETLRALVVAIAADNRRVCAIGRGWHCADLQGNSESVSDLAAWRSRFGDARPRAAVGAATPDALSPTILHAAALGFPLVVHAPTASATRDLGALLRIRQHVLTFRGAADLKRLLNHDPDELRTIGDAAASHVRQAHAWAVRFQQAWSDVIRQLD